jgi:integrase
LPTYRLHENDLSKTNFTHERVKALQCASGKQQTFYWDAKTPGLGVRVTANSAKSFIFETRVHGKTRRITIGSTLTWTLGGAQAKATEWKVLADQGIDPSIRLAEQRAQAEAESASARRRAVTLGDVWPVYLEKRKALWGERHLADHVKLAQPSGAENARTGKPSVGGPLFPLMSVPLGELDSSKIATWLHAESGRPTSTALAYRMLRAFIRWASETDEFRELIPEGAYSARVVREAVHTVKPKQDDCLEKQQLRPWFAAVQKITNPTIRTYLQALLITGARREELATLKWGDVSFTWHYMELRDKVEGKRKIPLTPYLAKLLAALRATDGMPSDAAWVFRSSRSKDGRLTEPRIAHLQALEAAGLPHLTLHGLRRTFGTLCDWVEIPVGVAAQIMGHKPTALAEKHYRRRTNDMLLEYHGRVERWILKEAAMSHLLQPSSTITAHEHSQEHRANVVF